VNAMQRIHSAARGGALDEVKALVGEDPSLVHATNEGSPWPTPLHQAAGQGHVEVARWLLDHGADARWSGPQTPLHVAWQRANNMEVIRLLVARGAAPSEIFAVVYLNDRDRVVALLEAEPEWVHDRDDAGMTPLHRAAENGQAEVVEALLAHGADVEAQTCGGQTPLQRSYYHSGIVDVLLAHGASMDIFTAINLDKTEYVARLLGREPSLVRAKMWDQTPLQIAARRDNADLVRLLLDHGADVDANGGWKGWMPLHWAAYDGRAEIVTLLLASAADVRARDQDGKPPVTIAAERGHGEIVRLLHQHGTRA